jgi:hypothetical protein
MSKNIQTKRNHQLINEQSVDAARLEPSSCAVNSPDRLRQDAQENIETLNEPPGADQEMPQDLTNLDELTKKAVGCLLKGIAGGFDSPSVRVRAASVLLNYVEKSRMHENVTGASIPQVQTYLPENNRPLLSSQEVDDAEDS